MGYSLEKTCRLQQLKVNFYIPIILLNQPEDRGGAAEKSDASKKEIRLPDLDRNDSGEEEISFDADLNPFLNAMISNWSIDLLLFASSSAYGGEESIRKEA